VADVRPPTPPDYEYGQFKALPGTSGVAGVPDTFYGTRNKAYADFISRQLTRLRGVNAYYYVLEDQNRRIDGDHPLSNAGHRSKLATPETQPDDPFARKKHAGLALYGERVIIKSRIDSAKREIQPDWPYMQPILVRGRVDNVEHEQEPDERGVIYVRRCDFYLARVLCDREWNLQPRPGDVVRFTKGLDMYMDVEDVDRDSEGGRFGGDGFFTAYKMILVKSSKYEPQRKIAERKLSESPPDGSTGDTTPGDLSPDSPPPRA